MHFDIKSTLIKVSAAAHLSQSLSQNVTSVSNVDRRGSTLPSSSADSTTVVLGGSEPTGNLFAVMMAYQKMMNKEAREDRRSSRDDAHSYVLALGTSSVRTHSWDE